MKIKSVTIENYRSHKKTTVNLRNYNLITGPNSSGKSNLFSAILCFYNYKGIKFVESKDGSKFTVGQMSRIIVDYDLGPKDSDVRELFKLEADVNSLSISCDLNKMEYACKTKPTIKKGDILKFLKKTKIIFIPAIPDNSETFKLTGPSLMREALTEILKEIWDKSPEANIINEEMTTLLSKLNGTTSNNGISPRIISEKINESIGKVNLSLRFDVKHIDFTTIISSVYNVAVTDRILQDDIDPSVISTGQMKYLFYSLIRVLKDMNLESSGECPENPLKFLIFEEPEAFLHPSNQLSLAETMRNLSKSEEWQFALSTHSPYFVSKEIAHMQDIIRIDRDEHGVSNVHQINDDQFSFIKDNKEFITYIKQLKNNQAHPIRKFLEGDIDRLLKKHELGLDEFMYNLYLNSERSRLFLSNKVIICEGISDKILIDHFIKVMGEKYISDIYVLECNGKYDIIRYKKVLDYFGIKHCIIYDTDSDKDSSNNLSVNLNQYIKKSITNDPGSFVDSLCFEPNLEKENSFFIKKEGDLKLDEKPLYLIKMIEENNIPNLEKVQLKITNLIEKLYNS